MSIETKIGRIEQPQDEQNEALLAQSELGVILLEAYREATMLDPRLEEMRIVPITDENDKRHGYARKKWAPNNTSGRHEVHIRLNNLDSTLDYYEKSIQDYQASVAMIAERLHIDPSEVTPQFLYVQSVLHEIGHVAEYMDYENDPQQMELRDKREKSTLPLGYASLTKLMDPTSELRQAVDQHWDEICQKHNVHDIDGLARVQGAAYRNLTSGNNADQFATSVFEMNPQMYGQLMQPNIDSYRNFPAAV